MSIDSTRAKIIASIWQAVAQSGVELSTLPMEQQEKLISKIADQMMVTLDGLLDEVNPEPKEEAPSTATDEYSEEILWKGRPFLSLIENYTITNDRVKVVHGLLGKDIENFELVRIQDLDMTRGLTERLMNLGDIHITGHDPSDPKIILRNISQPEVVYELLRKAWLAARKRHGLQFREYM
ncbi:MAG: PH domain-containing protein [Anaerolineales bacterium]|jgi:hypothetical protein|nr:PH domain-containing protein [Anaerolineales bacterium]